jgi:hypothetical protein
VIKNKKARNIKVNISLLNLIAFILFCYKITLGRAIPLFFTYRTLPFPSSFCPLFLKTHHPFFFVALLAPNFSPLLKGGPLGPVLQQLGDHGLLQEREGSTSGLEERVDDEVCKVDLHLGKRGVSSFGKGGVGEAKGFLFVSLRG